jgi:hypothetical protein
MTLLCTGDISKLFQADSEKSQEETSITLTLSRV